MPRAPSMRGIYMRGFTPHPDRRWYGHRPYPDRGGIHPTSRACFGKKLPKNPKKPDRIGFYLSNKDSKQGCHTAALFLCSAHTVRHRIIAPTPHSPTAPPAPRRSPIAHLPAALRAPSARRTPRFALTDVLIFQAARCPNQLGSLLKLHNFGGTEMRKGADRGHRAGAWA